MTSPTKSIMLCRYETFMTSKWHKDPFLKLRVLLEIDSANIFIN